jgi:hypothetical protein
MEHPDKQITRRGFIVGATAVAATHFCLPLLHAAERNTITKVHVVFKTHLDIGFTDMGEQVLQKYLNAFIPRAMKLAETTRQKHLEPRFRWTTGSWLIYRYLEEVDRPRRKRMEDAIAAGDICWHALPFTMHSETLDSSLFDLGTKLSKRLDTRFGKKTIGAKMTDVPGHTRSIVPRLQAAGIKFLHIGVNPASSPPKVPQLFNWRAPDGSKVVVMYDVDYGGQAHIPGTSEAVEIILTGDNHGPCDENAITKVYQNLEKQFPAAKIVASDLNQIAAAVSKVSAQLPVIKSELGDSWIHGIGSDPKKIAQLRELSRLRRTWIQSGELQEGSDRDLAFGIPLAMVAEHTWGLDVKTHLKSWNVYTPEALAAAREQKQFKWIEASWQEKRNFIQDGIKALPEEMKMQAQAALKALKPEKPNLEGWKKLDKPVSVIDLPQFLIALDPTGALRKLQNRKDKREWAAADQPLGCFAFQSFNNVDYNRFQKQYLTQRPGWALADLGKPGLDKIDAVSQTTTSRLTGAWIKSEAGMDLILAELEVVDYSGKAIPGCPKELTLQYAVSKAEPVIDITLQWFSKQANRLPEAMWFSFVPPVLDDGKWMMDKTGQVVDPRDVVVNGGHKMHAVGNSIRYSDSNGKMTINSLDAPLVAPGERTLLDFDNEKPSPSDGMHFCLCNNVWGTNFVMWFEDDMRFRFKVRC